MSNQKWTVNKIRDGFEKFYELHSRYPTAHDIDDFHLLPSSRQIQRKFGGLTNLRKVIGLEIVNYGRGKD